VALAPHSQDEIEYGSVGVSGTAAAGEHSPAGTSGGFINLIPAGYATEAAGAVDGAATGAPATTANGVPTPEDIDAQNQALLLQAITQSMAQSMAQPITTTQPSGGSSMAQLLGEEDEEEEDLYS
jgi:hypothetical protein